MISLKTVIGVIAAAIVIGVLFVFFEKSFMNGKIAGPDSSSAQELSKEGPIIQETSIINLPESEKSAPPIDESSNLLNEAESLEMRDYSGYFEELKESVQ